MSLLYYYISNVSLFASWWSTQSSVLHIIMFLYNIILYKWCHCYPCSHILFRNSKTSVFGSLNILVTGRKWDKEHFFELLNCHWTEQEAHLLKCDAKVLWPSSARYYVLEVMYDHSRLHSVRRGTAAPNFQESIQYLLTQITGAASCWFSVK